MAIETPEFLEEAFVADTRYRLHDLQSLGFAAHSDISGDGENPRAFFAHFQKKYGLPQQIMQELWSKPDFFYQPSRADEKRFPVDLAMRLQGVIGLFQFKTAKCLTAPHPQHVEKREGVHPQLDYPIYRVEFSGALYEGEESVGSKAQHHRLRILAQETAHIDQIMVRYIAPNFHRLSELAHLRETGLQGDIEGRYPITSFEPAAVTLNGDEKAWVSFNGKASQAAFLPSPAQPVPVMDFSRDLKAHSVECLPIAPILQDVKQELIRILAREGKVTETTLDPETLYDLLGIRKPRRDDIAKFSFQRIPFPENELDHDRMYYVHHAISRILEQTPNEWGATAWDFLQDYVFVKEVARTMLGAELVILPRLPDR